MTRRMVNLGEALSMYQRRAQAQLAKSLGAEEADRIVREALARIATDRISTPEHLLHFAECLMQRGGVPEIVGRSLRAHAILKGARVEEAHASPR